MTALNVQVFEAEGMEVASCKPQEIGSCVTGRLIASGHQFSFQLKVKNLWGRRACGLCGGVRYFGNITFCTFWGTYTFDVMRFWAIFRQELCHNQPEIPPG